MLHSVLCVSVSLWVRSTYSLIFIDGIPNTYHWRGGGRRRRKSRCQCCCMHKHWMQYKASPYHLLPAMQCGHSGGAGAQVTGSAEWEAAGVWRPAQGGDGQEGKWWCHHLVCGCAIITHSSSACISGQNLTMLCSNYYSICKLLHGCKAIFVWL